MGKFSQIRSGEMLEMKPILCGSGYYQVTLCKYGKLKKYLVHRLVALHFICNPRKLNVTDHIDGNKLNNKASNLRWVTYQENRLNPNTSWKNEKPVARFTLDGKYIDERASIQAYQDEYGFIASNIVSCLKGKRKSANGYRWMYLDKQGYLENF